MRRYVENATARDNNGQMGECAFFHVHGSPGRSGGEQVEVQQRKRSRCGIGQGRCRK